MADTGNRNADGGVAGNQPGGKERQRGEVGEGTHRFLQTLVRVILVNHSTWNFGIRFEAGNVEGQATYTLGSSPGARRKATAR